MQKDELRKLVDYEAQEIENFLDVADMDKEIKNILKEKVCRLIKNLNLMELI